MAVISQILETMEKFPQKPALICREGTVTYNELRMRIRCVAHKARAAGIEKGDIVPILLERGLDAVVAMLGVLYAGAAVCNVDTAYPPERVQFIGKDTAAKMWIDQEWMRTLGSEEMEEPIIAADESRAFVVYTSGSTGNPKGVVLSQKTLQRSLHSLTLGRTDSDVFLSVAAFSFIAVATDVLVPMWLGATLHIADERARRDPDTLGVYIKDNGITTAFFPPQLAKCLISSIEDHMRVLMVGSERVRGLYSAKMQIFNVYGCSETCSLVSSFLIDRCYDDSTPIGFPPEGVDLYLLDDNGCQVGAGEVGEICISGQLAGGYLNLPEKTAESFISNPFAKGVDDAVLYRTGDLGCFREDGALLYVQRKDWMLKVRGYRVEPGEIEAAILRLTPARQVVVKGYENAAGETSLFAVYTADETLSPTELIRAVKAFLPDYMVPSLWEQIPAMPLNANGKIDRKNIAPPHVEKQQTEFEPPVNEQEEGLCRAFAEMLGLSRAGALDDFVSLGGDSMSAMRVQVALPQYGLSSVDILTLRTPRALAQHVRDTKPLVKAAPRVYYPLTFAEEQMAIEQFMDPQSKAYNINLAFEISGSLDSGRLEAALNALICRHAVLRSCYRLASGEYRHYIHEEMTAALVYETCDADGVQARINERNATYDLGTGPLFRFTLFAIAKDRHILHMGFHHIIMDGTSAPTLLHELWTLYEGRDLPPVALDYMDFAVWQSEREEDKTGRAFFMEMFAGGLPETEMPTLPKRPDVLPFADTDLFAVLSASKLDFAARRYEVTAYTLLTAALGLTVAKYCGTEEVALGLAVNGRMRAELAEMPGMFVNTVPLRFTYNPLWLTSDLLHNTSNVLNEVLRHQDYPFEKLVLALAPDRNTSRGPVHDVLLNYLEALPDKTPQGLLVREYPVKKQALAMDLVLEAVKGQEELVIKLSYSPKLYDEKVAEGFLEQFCHTLEQLMTGDAQPVLFASELPEAQTQRLLVDFHGAYTDENNEKTVVDLFREQVIRTPDHIAVVYDKTKLTYRELDRITDNLAAYLSAKGVSKGHFVGALVGRSEMMPVCSIGVLKSGAAYLPLDPTYPPERLTFMLQDAGANVVLLDTGLEMLIPGYKGTTIFTSEIYALPDVMPNCEPIPDDALILLYTSGTTGQPKGVVLTHGNLTNFCTWYKNEHNLTNSDAVIAYASFGFDANMMDTYPTLISGACVHIIPEEMRLDLPGLDRYCAENNITIAFMTTQLGRQYAEMKRKSKIRVLSVGGETLVPITPPEGLALYNVYGPTECTVLSSYYRVEKVYDRVPIGFPLSNMALYIIDRHGRLAPVGVAGELCIAGKQVGAGYLNRPELSAEKFAKNPFSDDPAYSRMYRTGDMARFLPDGSVDFIGRTDFQIKIRGFRVELTEIEGRIREYEGITDAAVVALDAPGGGKCAVAYIVAGAPVEVERLNAFILEALPPYMVPAAVMQLEKIPLNANGKVDRRKLPAPVYHTATAAPDEQVRPTNLLEEKLVDAVKEVLGHDQFSLTSNLLQAGLASLSAIKLMAKLDDVFGTAPAVKEFMREPTVIGVENMILARLLTHKEEAPAAESTSRGSYPLSYSQMGIYLDCMKAPESIHYNVPLFFSLPVSIDAARLQNAIRTVFEAHPMLDVHLAEVGGNVVQTRGHFPVEVVLNEVSEEELVSFKNSFRRPFDLMRGPLYRAAVIGTPTQIVVLLDFHHIVFDGASADLFLRSIGHAYDGRPLAPERIDGLAAALADHEQEGSDQWKTSKAFFDKSLDGFEAATELPGDMGSYQSAGLMREAVCKVNRNKVEAFCKDKGITPAALFAAATAYTISRWVGSQKVYLSMISSGRDDPRLQNTVGMFVRTLPLVLERGKQQTTLAFIRRVQQDVNDTIAHENYPFTRIVQETGYQPSIMYACELGVVNQYQVGGVTPELEEPGQARAKFKLSVHIEERDGDMLFAVQYDEGFYSEMMMETFSETLGCALEGLISAPEAPITALSLMSERQRQLVQSFDRRDHSPELVLHRLFEQAAAETPDHVALEATDGVFTYAGLNAKANQLAHGLLARGLQREDRVALLLRRTSHVLIAMLGVLKAGGAYIPLDPEYPEERVRHVRDDSAAKFLLCEQDVDRLCENQPDHNPDVPVSPQNLAYLIYTSGSTGKPKGVMIEHRGIANYVLPHPENRHIHALKQDASKMLSVTTVAFDMFLKESLASLCNGLTLVLADEQSAHDPILLAKLLEDTGADVFNATPSVMMEYAAYPPLLAAIRRCRVVMCGAEKYPEALLQKFADTNIRLFNTYGPTEITVSCNAKELTGASHVTVGAPLYGVFEEVVDEDGNALPCFMTGELYIGGRGLARGYVNLPDQTAERFILFDGQRVYRSGDLARRTPDGEIEILGRNDSQIKLRGLRIELGEIETALLNVEGVTAGAVIIRKIQGQDHLCAYYIADKPVLADTIRDRLRLTLTQYMVPSAYLQIDAMPKTPNGKNDLRALPEPELLRSGGYEAPRNETEAKVCDVFAEALGLETVGALDSFFELGGSSLMVTRVVIGAENAGLSGDNGIKITYADVFARPTPRELAALLIGGEDSHAQMPKEEYDYSAISVMLREQKEIPSQFENLSGSVLLTGATGFLGIHMLHAMLTGEHATDITQICCLVRKGQLKSAQQRLKNMLFYYFEDSFDELWGKKLVVIDGDMTNAESLAQVRGFAARTVINCAANVSHFARDEASFDVNVLGVRNLINYCRETKARLIHISTTSVGGFSVDGKPPRETKLDETMLYFGQSLDNQYVYSKFLAEREILESCLTGLDAKIMRVGNLMARNRDGEFQINARGNSFLGRLRAYATLGCFPYSAYSTQTELAPIDSTASAILHLCGTPSDCHIFHPYNNHYLFMGDIIGSMRDSGIAIRLVEDKEFEHELGIALRDPVRAENLTSIVAYRNLAGGKAAVPVGVSCERTVQTLLRRGWHWPETSADYQRGFIRALAQMGMFGGEELV